MSKNTWCAAGGTPQYSTDLGLTWHMAARNPIGRGSPHGEFIPDCAYGEGQFIMVGTSNDFGGFLGNRTMMGSSDASHYEIIHNPADGGFLNHIAFGGGRWVAGQGQAAPPLFITAPADGRGWTVPDVSALVAMNGGSTHLFPLALEYLNGQFVASVTNGGSQWLGTSPDGEHWTWHAMSSTGMGSFGPSDIGGHQITYMGGRYVFCLALGPAYTPAGTSPPTLSGIAWATSLLGPWTITNGFIHPLGNEVLAPGPFGLLQATASSIANNGSVIVAGGTDYEAVMGIAPGINISTDGGATWSIATTAPNSITFGPAETLTWDPIAGLFVLITSGDHVFTSPDGETWTHIATGVFGTGFCTGLGTPPRAGTPLRQRQRNDGLTGGPTRVNAGQNRPTSQQRSLRVGGGVPNTYAMSPQRCVHRRRSKLWVPT